MITSPHNEKLKTIRKLRSRRDRARTSLFLAEGEDLIEAALAAGCEPQTLLVAGEHIEQHLLDSVSAIGSGTRAIGVFRQRWSEPQPATQAPIVSVYLHALADPGNVGTVIRSAHALADGPVAVGPGCADPYSPKAVRASMGSIFARPPVRATIDELAGAKLALDPAAPATLAEIDPAPPLVVCVGAERAGLPEDLLAAADQRVRIPIRPGGPDSLNAAMAATVALYELGNRMAGRG